MDLNKTRYMYEKVNPQHPDKIADRIAGALVDLAYRQGDFPHVAVEVLIGHGKCHIINETDTPLEDVDVLAAVKRITKSETIDVDYVEVQQDALLNANQHERVRCGDNGIFKGMPVTQEQKDLARIAGAIYESVGTDGKYILDATTNELIICQSFMNNDKYKELSRWLKGYKMSINPIGEWTGGTDVDTGATNRKLGSDMGDAVTGGGLHGKDLSKADVAVNIYLHQLAQRNNRKAQTWCAIGDDTIILNDGSRTQEVRYCEVVDTAAEYIKQLGGFEKLAEWGFIRP